MAAMGLPRVSEVYTSDTYLRFFGEGRKSVCMHRVRACAQQCACMLRAHVRAQMPDVCRDATVHDGYWRPSVLGLQ